MHKRKLIEVALPLEAINRESAREKAVRHGHPSTLHLWWSRKPLATARAVLFAQLVDDPSSDPVRFPDEGSQRTERERLHALIKDLIAWDAKPETLDRARVEIERAAEGAPPVMFDPFAGGGSIPLEAARLGLRVRACDLNPVATLINKALLEVPTGYGAPPVAAGLADSMAGGWSGYSGLAADVLAYGEQVLADVRSELSDLYPRVVGPDGRDATVIAWLWARSVKCDNPGCGIEMPIVSKWWLGKKPSKEAYVVPKVVEADEAGPRRVEFDIGHDRSGPPVEPTALGRPGARCLACGHTASLAYIKKEGHEGRLGAMLMAVAIEGKMRRHYLPATRAWEEAAEIVRPDVVPDVPLSTHSQYMGAPQYGMTTVADLFTPRQLQVMVLLSNCISRIGERVLADQAAQGRRRDEAYARAVVTYLGLALSRYANYFNSLCRWRPDPGKEQSGDMFSMQAIQIVWDYSEASPWSNSAGGWVPALRFVSKAIERLPLVTDAEVWQGDAGVVDFTGSVVSSDPPYFDYVPYSDLSDFFYAWLRFSLRDQYPELLSTIVAPKDAELVADHERQKGRAEAAAFFQSGFREIFRTMRASVNHDYPATVYYAFRESTGTRAAAGWETILQSMVDAGWAVTATWPMRSELGNRSRSIDSNALASSIVLALRPRELSAPATDRRGFIDALTTELPGALRRLQQGQVAPVDLPQASIGPGMAVFTQFRTVLEDDGSTMSVGGALARINEVLDAVLNEQEGDFDPTTRFAIQWYRQHGYSSGKFGDADSLARARNTSVDVMDRMGVLASRGGKLQLFAPSDLAWDYDVVADLQTSNWEALHHLIRILERDGIAPAGDFLRAALDRRDGTVDEDLVKELGHLLFRIAEGNGWTKDALSFNNLVTSWPDIVDVARDTGPKRRSAAGQGVFDFDEDD